MSEPKTQSGWTIYSGQRSVPYTLGVGQHNYLLLVDPQGRVGSEIHGTTDEFLLGGTLQIRERPVVYKRDGTRE
ncbi:MAG: hypothetical protein Kilf2KO_07740 [Rhodospirillales bacterium]